MKKFWFIRGVSGAGKSTVADLISSMAGVTHVEADQFRYVDGQYKYTPEGNHLAHKGCFNRAKDFVLGGAENVVVSNTSTRSRDVEKYKDLAEQNGYMFISLVVENYHETGNTHGVPEETLCGMEKQLLGSIKLK